MLICCKRKTLLFHSYGTAGSLSDDLTGFHGYKRSLLMIGLGITHESSTASLKSNGCYIYKKKIKSKGLAATAKRLPSCHAGREAFTVSVFIARVVIPHVFPVVLPCARV
jgi:hypothetical protein